MKKKNDSDFRYNTGETRVPWAAVGENYNAVDTMEVVRFLMQGEGKEYDAALQSVREAIQRLDGVSCPPGKLSLDAQVARAEALCDDYLQTKGCLFVTNATAGFEIAYQYANIGPGDEVIVPAITFIATMAYPLSVGAKIVFADVDPVTLNMDPIMELAREHDILVLEDAAHAFGAEYKGRKVGTIGHFGAFSFHEVKNITSFGEGGILATSIESFRPELRRARFLGLDFSKQIKDWLYDVSPITGKYGPFVAGNHSTTEIQALGLARQVERVDKIISLRRQAAAYLTERLSADPAIIPQDLGSAQIKPTFHLYRLLIDPALAGGDVQVLKRKLAEKGVTTIPHFGPLYRFQVAAAFGYNGDEIAKTCPVCEEVFHHRFTHFPIYGLSQDQLSYMADAILESISEMRREAK